MKYDLLCPWNTLDEWQKSYIETDGDCFILSGRQCGKTTGMSIKSVELCIKRFKRGESVLIASITEKQGYLMLQKALNYAMAKYPKEIKMGKDKPTMHRIMFKNGTQILCYAAGETGEGLRGFTIKKLMIDEASRMSDAFFVSVSPALSVVGGTMDIASTPCGKQGFFFECSKSEKFNKFYVSAEDCPRHTREFLEGEKARLSKLAYSQEYLALFLDELRRIYSDSLLSQTCVLNRNAFVPATYYLGVDIARMGLDLTSFAILKLDRDKMEQVENVITKKTLTTDTTQKILELDNVYNFRRIGLDDGGLGVAVYDPLLRHDKTKGKVIGLNNASRSLDRDKEQRKKLLKEDMYFNLLALMEQGKIKLLNDDEVLASLRSIQYEQVFEDNKPTKLKIWGDYSHTAEAIIRAAWLAVQDKGLNIWVVSKSTWGQLWR